MLHGRGESRLLISGPCGEHLQGYSDGPYVITKALKSGRGNWENQRIRERLADAMLLALKIEGGPSAKEYRQSLDAGKGKEMETSERNTVLLTL